MIESNMYAAQQKQIVGLNVYSETTLDRTVGENIDAKITMLKAEIQRLEESKTALAPLMNMKIRDIREAMNY